LGAARDGRLCWNGYGGMQGLIYIGEKTCSRGQDLSIRGLVMRKTEWPQKIGYSWEKSLEGSRNNRVVVGWQTGELAGL